MEKKYRVKKILNNNAVYATANFLEYIVIGLGIGFSLKPNQIIPSEKIEKVFTLEKEDVGRVMQLAQEVPQELFMSLYNMIHDLSDQYQLELDNHAYIAMIDHIQYSITRHNQNQSVQNLLNPDLKIFYPEEFKMATALLQNINQTLKINLPEDEIGFLTIHIMNGINTALDNQTNTVTESIYDALNIIRDHYLIALKLSDVNTQRITIHLKMLIQRILSKTQILESEVILEEVITQFEEASLCAHKIQNYLEKKLKEKINLQEIIYLTIHLNRLESMTRTH